MIKGSIVDLVTPTHADGAPDFETLETLVDWHVDEGSAALVIGGGPDPAAKLEIEERTELFRRAVWQADGRIPIVADIGGATTADALEAALAADEAGVDAALAVAPVAASPSPEELLRHFQAIAEAGKRPLLVRDSVNRPNLLSSAIVTRLARIDGIVGFVERGVNADAARELLAIGLPEGFALYAGADVHACKLLSDGFAGVVSVTANVAPASVRKMCAAALAGDRDQAATVDVDLQPLDQALIAGDLVAAVKWALIEIGRIEEGPHPPTLPQASDYSNLRRALRAVHVLD